MAGRDSSPSASAALEKLCRIYWYPLYGFVRRRGHSAEDAQDLTQEFFARFLEKKYFKLADPACGRFRAFLLTSLKHFMVHEWEKAQTAKRGGGQQIISWDEQAAESRYHLEPVSNQTAESLFDRRWALTLFELALDQLKEEFAIAGKGQQFGRLKEFLSSETSKGAYDAAASELDMSPGAVSVAVHRLRARYGELVRRDIANTVSTPAEVEEELRYFIGLALRET